MGTLSRAAPRDHSEYLSVHRRRWESPHISASERQGMDALLDGSAPPEAYEQSAFRLSQFLSRLAGESVILLIDEYDSPIHAGVENGFYHEVIDFFRTFFGSALKDNQSLFKCVITGIMRVSKEGLFSALNNLRVYTVLSDEFQADFGFTEPEVEALLQEFKLSDRLHAIRRTYNGYRVGRNKFVDLYNPWSMLAYLNSSGFTLEPYWMNTGSTELIDALVYKHGDRIRKPLETLLTGGAIDCLYNDSLTFAAAEEDEDSFFTFLLHAGYLKPRAVSVRETENRVLLEIPNQALLDALHQAERELKRIAQKQALEQERLAKEQEKPKAKEQTKAKAHTRRTRKRALSLEERLALEDKIVPHVTNPQLAAVWTMLGFAFADIPHMDTAIVWNDLLTRCEQSAQLGSLAKLLELKCPPLVGEPLLSVLKEK